MSDHIQNEREVPTEQRLVLKLGLKTKIFSPLLPHSFENCLRKRNKGGCYILLYYAFLSNFQTNAVAMVKKSLFLSLVSGLIVALWGLPSRFGYDPTCFLFRGTFDVSCWTADFMPKVRIFSTLGQPDWLAAYLAILIPISIAFAIKNSKS